MPNIICGVWETYGGPEMWVSMTRNGEEDIENSPDRERAAVVHGHGTRAGNSGESERGEGRGGLHVCLSEEILGCR